MLALIKKASTRRLDLPIGEGSKAEKNCKRNYPILRSWMNELDDIKNQFWNIAGQSSDGG